MLRRGKEEATQPPLAVASARAPSGTASPRTLCRTPCCSRVPASEVLPGHPTHGHRLSFDFLSRSSELVLLFNVKLSTCAPALAHTHGHTAFCLIVFPSRM